MLGCELEFELEFDWEFDWELLLDRHLALYLVVLKLFYFILFVLFLITFSPLSKFKLYNSTPSA